MVERCIDVQQSVAYLEAVLGTTWLKESLKQLKGFAGGGGSLGRGIDPVAGGISLTAYYWYRAREELALQGIGGDGPGLYTLYAAVIGDDLLALRGSAGLATRIEGLKRPADARDVLLELGIASGYARRGRRVSFAGDAGYFQADGPVVSVFVEPAGGSADDMTVAAGHVESGLAIETGKRCINVAQVIYRHEEDEPEKVLPVGTGLCGAGSEPDRAPVVVFKITACYESRCPVMTRYGFLQCHRQHLKERVYIPGEKIMPARD